MSDSTLDALLAGFATRVREPVLWGDMDAFGHVNNTVYLRYFESARIAYFQNIGLIGEVEEMTAGPILAATDCRFKLPLTYPDTVDIGARVTDIGADRFQMAYRVVSRAKQRIAADGGGEIVLFNYQTGRKTTLPDALRKRIETLENRVYSSARPTDC